MINNKYSSCCDEIPKNLTESDECEHKDKSIIKYNFNMNIFLASLCILIMPILIS